MSIFKVGDKVKAVGFDGSGLERYQGRTATVTKVGPVYINVDWDMKPGENYLNGNGWGNGWLPSRFTLIEAKVQPEFKVGDKVRYTGKSKRSPELWVRYIGLEGVVTEVAHNSVSFKITKTVDSVSFKLGDIYNGAMTENVELITDPERKFKVGDKVRFNNTTPIGYWFGPHTQYKTGIVTRNDRDGSYQYAVQTEKKAPEAYVIESMIELVTEEVKTVEVRAKPKARFIVAVEQGGTLAPNEKPREYSSLRQAESVAKKMAEKHGQTFYVLQAVAAAVPPLAPKAELVKL
jgi:ASC-1-like (ASCH) protein